MSALSRLSALQAETFQELRSSESQSATVVQLVEQSCVMEVGRLTSAISFLRGYAEAVVDVIGQFLPGAKVGIGVRRPGPTEPLWIGHVDEAAGLAALERLGTASIGECLQFADRAIIGMYVQGELVGCLTVSEAPPMVLDSSLLTNLSAQVADGLAIVITTERLRREAAAANLTKALVNLTEGYGEADLAHFAEELALLEGATGVRLHYDNPHLGGPADISAGEAVTGPAIRSHAAVDSRFPLQIDVGHRPDAASADVQQLSEFIDLFFAALGRVEETRRLRGESETDSLTGVGNRRAALKALGLSVERARRTDEQVAVLLFDLDHFKSVNDNFGHYVGDNVLVAVARGVAQSLRPFDTVARVGGEEFLVICPGTDWTTAAGIAERLLQLVPVLANAELPEQHAQTISAGVALYPDTATTPEVLLRRVDDALYEAKRAGRNQFALTGQPKGHPPARSPSRLRTGHR